MDIAVVGTGYVGLVTGVCLAEVGHHVVCVDTNEDKIAKLRSGLAPIFEPGIEGLLKRNLEHERLAFTSQLEHALAGASCVFIAVGTPQGEDGSADLQYVLAVARQIGQKAKKEMLVIVKSTVPVGTCDEVERVLQRELDNRGVEFRLGVASNPEFLKEGTAIDDFMKPDRVVCGVADDRDRPLLREMYQPFVMDDPGKVVWMDRRSSELTKYAANCMLATRISFMNELARLCDNVGANIDNIRLGMGLDPRIGRKFLYAGPGYGGSCFPKDVKALLNTGARHGVALDVLNAVSRANDAQKRYVAQKVHEHFAGDLAGKRIAVWGLSFKPGTDDVRESPAMTIIDYLLGYHAEVVGHDPEGRPNFAREFGTRQGLSYATTAYEALKGADALVLVTEWSEYKRPNWDKVKGLMRGTTVFDFRNQYSREALEAAGLRYVCIGRAAAAVGAKSR